MFTPPKGTTTEIVGRFNVQAHNRACPSLWDGASRVGSPREPKAP